MTQALRREHAQFWHEVLAAGPTRFFAAHPGDDQRHELRQALPDGLLAAATGRPHGLHLLIAGAVVALLHRYTHAESVTIGQGAPIGGGVDGTGPDALIPVRCAVFGTDTFTDVVNRLRTAVFDSYAHQNFDVGVLRHGAPYQVAVRVEGLHVEPDPEHVPLLLDVAATGELTARAAGIGKDVVARLLRHLTTLLDQVLACPGLVLDEVDLLTEADIRLWERCNDTARPIGPHRTVPAMFAHAVATRPDARALLSPDGVLTYRELDERTDSLAAAIVERGAGRVAVIAERSPGLVIAILAVLKAGAAYVPIDPSLPAERIDFVLRDSGASMVLRGDTEVPSRPLPAVTVRPEDPAYVIYTSGSTGEPKGVVVEHRSVANLLVGTQRAYPLGPDDVILHKTSISFDVSVWELFGWLAGGGALALLPPGAERDPDAVIDAVERYEVTALDLVPQMLGALADVVVARNAVDRMRTLRLVSSGSDELTPDHVRRFRRALRQTRLVNFYGPTEATVQVTHFAVGDVAGERVPIGGPLDNTRLHVVDRLLRPQAVGVPGELCVAGDSLARGYLNRPDLTAERFVPAPSLGEARVYRTGDLCRRLDDGTLEFLGRIDQQVKVRGYRVEPGEIEHQLRACPGVDDAIVVATGGSTQDRRLVAYVTGAQPPHSDDVLRRLREVLPAYMVPAAVHRLAAFPVTVSGKADRARLAASAAG
ncbi:amino acid adenylation domain-containing protein [Streptomyces atratus]